MRQSPLIALLVFAFIWPAAAQEREQVVRVPGPGGATMIATVMRPPGEARQPLVVIIDHGSPADSAQRPKMERARYSTVSAWFLARGYVVVLPMRRGSGDAAGGEATYRPVGPFGRDGHLLAGSESGVPIWSPLVTSFLAGLK